MIEVDLNEEKKEKPVVEQPPVPKVETRKTVLKTKNGKIFVKKQKGGFRISKLFSLLFVLLAFGVLGIFLTDKLGNNIFSICQDGDCEKQTGFLSGILAQDPELKQHNGYTSILVVGLDSRHAKIDGDTYSGDLMNTDTLIQVIYNHKNNETYMVSVPRDLYVKNEEVPYQGKINGLYVTAETKYGGKQAVEMLANQIEQMTGVETQYYAIVTFDIVKDLVETFGDEVNGEKGLYIDIEKSFKELFPNENGGTGYKTIYFEEGRQFLNTERLMEYSRARQLTSDWDRARRQQQVIDALKDKILSDDSMFDLPKLLELYQTFKKNVIMSPISSEDIKAGIELKDAVSGEYTSIVLDPKLGGLNKLISTLPAEFFQGASMQGPVDYDTTYSSISSYLQLVYNYPHIYEEESKIVVYNYTGETELDDSKIDKISSTLPVESSVKNYPVKELKNYELYDFSEGTKPETLKKLEAILGVKATPYKDEETGATVFQNYFEEDFSIRVGKAVEASVEPLEDTTTE